MLLAVLAALCQVEAREGYIFSVSNGGLVGYEDGKLCIKGPALPFTLDESMRLVSIPRLPATKPGMLRADMLEDGRLRIRKGSQCLSVERNWLRPRQCDKNSKEQKFEWFPTVMFHRPRASKKAKPGRRRSAVRYSEPGRRRRPRGPEGSEAYDTDTDGRPRDGDDDLDLPEVPTESADDPILPDADKEAERDEASLDGSAMLAESSEAEVKRKCIKNPENGECYFKLDDNGRISPLYQPKQKPGKSSKCRSGNHLDDVICNLHRSNKKSNFNKFISS